MKKTTIYFPDELKLSIESAARRRGESEARLIREAVVAYLAAEPNELPSVFGSVADGTLSAANYEDWLEENWKPDW